MRHTEKFSQLESDRYRYEKKFFIEGIDAGHLIAILKSHPACFRELYPPRYVNNIYLDSPLLEDFYSNINGYTSRRKVRIRWYHDLFRDVGDGVLEFKYKQGEVGTKEQYPFPPFRMKEDLTEGGLKETIRNSSLPAEIKIQLKDLEFAILNRYKRWYFATFGENFRATIDDELSFYQLGKLSNRFMRSQREYRKTIVELKYSVEDDITAHHLIAALPFRVTRSSKYVSGLEQVYL